MSLAPARRSRAGGTTLLIAVGLATTVGSLGLTSADAVTPSAAQADRRPNIVLISTDDQTLEQLRHMPRTRRTVGRRGLTFSEALASHPLCCPARAEILTGQHGHNNGVLHNRGPVGGYKSLRRPDATLPAWLQADGYQTSFIGKFLNGYRVPDHGRPAGWSRWNPAVKNIYSYTRTRFWQDGDPGRVRGNVDDAIGRFAARDIRAFAKDDAPFFLWVSHVAPHVAINDGRPGHPIPAERHRTVLRDVRAPSLDKPSFNEADVSDQPPYIREASKQPRRKMKRRYTRGIQALQAVDEAVARVVRVLRRVGELDRTYVVFTSDNGYLLGEHRIEGKNSLHEEATRIPLLVRTPDGVRGRSGVPVALVDLAPTIADLAGVTPGREVDGRSFRRLLSGQALPWRDTQLVQTGHDEGWAYRGVRTTRYTYARNATSGEELLYDRAEDPWEIENVAGDPRYAGVRTELRSRLQALRDCAGAGCSMSFGPVGGPADPP